MQNTGQYISNVSDFDSIYQRYGRTLYANIFKIVQQPEIAEDLLQEVFLALWENRRQVQADNIAGWLFVVSYNKSVSYLKKKLRESVIYVETNDLPGSIAAEEPLSEAVFAEQLQVMQEAINSLPNRKQQVFKLCRLEGKSCRETAAILGLTPASVKEYLKSATKMVKQYVNTRHPAMAPIHLSLLLLCISL